MKRPEQIQAYYGKNGKGWFEAPVWLNRTIVEKVFESDAFKPVIDEAFRQLKEIYEKYKALLNKCVERQARNYNPVYLPLGPALFALETPDSDYVWFKLDSEIPLIEDDCPELLDSRLRIRYSYGPRVESSATGRKPELPSRNMSFAPDASTPKGHGTVGKDSVRADSLSEMLYGNHSLAIDMTEPPSTGCFFSSMENDHGVKRIYVRCMGLEGDLGVERIASIFYDVLCPILDDLESFCADCLATAIEQEEMPLIKDVTIQ